MLFSRKKRVQRDRDAGLVFCWRGQGGNRSGLILALLIASGIYAAAFWGLSLKFKTIPAESNDSAKILLLDELSSEMALWVDQNTPFPVRWDPKNAAQHEDRVQAALNQVLAESAAPVSAWRSMPELPPTVSTPRIVELGVVQLGNLPQAATSDAVPTAVDLVVVLDAYGKFKKRLPSQVSALDIVIPMQQYGSGLRFVVGVDSSGSVVHCAPVEWQSSDYAHDIENWVRSQKFLPSAKKGNALEVGEIIVKVEAKSHAGN